MMSEQFENDRKFGVKTHCKTLMPKKCTDTPMNRWVCSKRVKKCSAFIFFECSQDAVCKMCRLEIRFQNLPFEICRCNMRDGPLCKSVLSETLMRFHLKRYALPCETLCASVSLLRTGVICVTVHHAKVSREAYQSNFSSFSKYAGIV